MLSLAISDATRPNVFPSRSEQLFKNAYRATFFRFLLSLQSLMVLAEIKKPGRSCPVFLFCERGDSNPHRLPHYHLKVARLPIPPLPQRGNEIIAKEAIYDK